MKSIEMLSQYASFWQILCKAKQENRLPHALLLMGAESSGKRQFAEQWAEQMLCMQGNGCGICHACHLMKAQSHPDFILVTPEVSQHTIKVDSIRAMIETVHTTSLQGKGRVVVIDPANAMNSAAANALLKTLEEPPPETLLMLISGPGQPLPKTVLSRCQKMVLSHSSQSLPSEMVTLRKELYDGLIALSQGKADPIQLATEWQAHDLLSIVQLLLTWLQDCLRFKVMGSLAEWVNNEYASELMGLTLSREALLGFLTLVQERYMSMVRSHNLNRQLILEELLIQWADCYGSS